ncbi:hypothetical protein QBC40DRAFT_273645 [Triangularia verruculosa]|uniref:Uncharacterized protein n=1 Tax=Triangularia verruculosa TaxID=2587418 RepID=A0AAN7AY63_9PEZI|nr:hypothetical protein QBC40DRAFT_273645 [Triangularia verruculosa]
MDDPAETCWSWPHWKFGLRRDDLFTKLHDQYNTVPTPILDPEAFHHDVYEISNEASTADEFHSLLRQRKQQRMRELNDSLESAAFEIIANPSLIGTDQWQHAVQLFRTKSLDSLVRYFSSYLPPDHPWYKDSASSSEAGSSVDSFAPSHGSLFDDDDGLLLTMTDEPLEFSTDLDPVLPPSPRSMTMCSDSSVASPIDDHHDYETPSRTLSYSESEPDCCDLSGSGPHSHHDGTTAQTESIDMESPAAPIPDTPQTESGGVEAAAAPFSERVGKAAQSFVVDNADMATPKPEGHVFFERKKTSPLSHRRHRSLSPSRPHSLADYEVDDLLHRDPRSAAQCLGTRSKRDCSPVQRKRKGPVGSLTRIQKPTSDASRSRPRGRRCFEN